MKKNLLLVLATVGLSVAAHAEVSWNISIGASRPHCAPPPSVIYVPAPACATPVVVAPPPCAPPVVYSAPCRPPNVIYFGGRHDNHHGSSGHYGSHGYRSRHGGVRSHGSVNVHW